MLICGVQTSPGKSEFFNGKMNDCFYVWQSELYDVDSDLTQADMP